jgi:anti-anti-sigma factor
MNDTEVLRFTATGDPPGLSIAGEIDEDSYPVLVRTLEEFAADRPEIHLDLAAVRYCDLAGLRAIVRLAEVRSDGHGRRVVLHELPPQLRTVLEIVGWDSTPGLIVDQPTVT